MVLYFPACRSYSLCWGKRRPLARVNYHVQFSITPFRGASSDVQFFSIVFNYIIQLLETKLPNLQFAKCFIKPIRQILILPDFPAIRYAIINVMGISLYFLLASLSLGCHLSSAFPQPYDRELYSAHTEALYKALLIHLDDPMSCVQVSAKLPTVCVLSLSTHTQHTLTCAGSCANGAEKGCYIEPATSDATGGQCQAQAPITTVTTHFPANRERLFCQINTTSCQTQYYFVAKLVSEIICCAVLVGMHHHVPHSLLSPL